MKYSEFYENCKKDGSQIMCLQALNTLFHYKLDKQKIIGVKFLYNGNGKFTEDQLFVDERSCFSVLQKLLLTVEGTEIIQVLINEKVKDSVPTDSICAILLGEKCNGEDLKENCYNELSNHFSGYIKKLGMETPKVSSVRFKIKTSLMSLDEATKEKFSFCQNKQDFVQLLLGVEPRSDHDQQTELWYQSLQFKIILTFVVIILLAIWIYNA